ncbi:Ig-like domain-containing protein [Pseudomonas baetica]|uniref:Ig-like domain-containing protein n=1 Tax=Pseudomonas baetica TaxID=674054 RepID=UPI002870BA21|nr:Ig-like domain-containing protein [Pseudomonas baetica]MDR9863940.1 Ig-like domain-containing protein [Pseudomonas baetica]
MEINDSTLDVVFDLFPLFVPGSLQPIKPPERANVGVPRPLYNDKPAGLLCVADPLTEMQLSNQVVEAYDSVDLHVNGHPTPVDSTTIQPGDEQKRISLNVPHGHFIHGVNRLHYQVRRLSGNVERSRDLLLLYHLRGPVNLTLVIPDDVVTNGVSSERAEQGVQFTLTYNPVQAYDEVRLRMGNELFTLEVSDPPTPVTMTLYTADFEKVGEGLSEVDFVVVDQLGHTAISASTTLNIHLTQDEPLLAPTLVKPAVSPIDVAAYPEGVTVQIEHPGALPDDWAQLVEVNPPDGTPPYPLEKFDTNNRVNTVLTQAFLEARQGTEISFQWILNPNGGQAEKSPVLKLSISKIAYVPPTIDSLKGLPSNVEIHDGTSTPETTFVLVGKGHAGKNIELLDANVLKATILVTDSGEWTCTLRAQTLGNHRYKVKALYGSGAESTQRTLTIRSPLSIDSSLMVLDGVKFHQSYGLSTREVPRNTGIRQATGGVPGITYRSSNPAIAHVSNTGKVSGLRSGTANIIAKDGTGAEVSFPVRVSNIYTLILGPITDRMNFDQLHSWGVARGGVVLPGAVDAGPVIRAFEANFSNYHQFFRQATTGMDPRYRVIYQTPTQQRLVAGHYITPGGNLSAIAWGPEGIRGFEGPAFTLIPS